MSRGILHFGDDVGCPAVETMGQVAMIVRAIRSIELRL